MHVDRPSTFPALDVTAPLEFAFTSFHNFLGERIVSSAAAHQRAAVGANGRFVTLPTGSAERARLGVGYAVVRGLFEVHQTVSRGFVESRVRVGELSLSVDSDLGGAVVLVLENAADLVEGRHLKPARL